jgi:flavin-binding protein dodecin
VLRAVRQRTEAKAAAAYVPGSIHCHRKETSMSAVTKVIEVSSASTKGIEDAVQDGLKKIAESVKGIKGAWVNDIKVITSDDGSVTEWRVNMRVSFVVS